MTSPMEATRVARINATIRDCLVGAWLEGGANAAVWTIDVGGREYAGPAVDAAKHSSLSGVKEMLQVWAKEHADLFA